ncbi:response regulator transcription factor [Paraburkholderia unamae]|uniref:LuxR family two component transcriptional regulator n=1 Tax=Paraburkholderia unamae TaxID=219649 RepID=A0ABX5KWS7_9BURK|nr:response regulator [Paraburkholderia unamae]PVX85912.1 LuxR family two component transcriptional regulator [Paraburkholderia unamae]
MQKNTMQPASSMGGAMVYVIDDDESVRSALSSLLRSEGFSVHTFERTLEFVAFDKPDVPSCLVLDVRLRGESGLTFQKSAREHLADMPIIFMTAHGNIEMSVQAMKAGALDFLAKPVRDQRVIDAVSAAIRRHAASLEKARSAAALRERYGLLTAREREVISYVIDGLLNKQIAGKMNLSEITVKIYRSSAMRKLGAQSVADLVRKMEHVNSTTSFTP